MGMTAGRRDRFEGLEVPDGAELRLGEEAEDDDPVLLSPVMAVDPWKRCVSQVDWLPVGEYICLRVMVPLWVRVPR